MERDPPIDYASRLREIDPETFARLANAVATGDQATFDRIVSEHELIRVWPESERIKLPRIIRDSLSQLPSIREAADVRRRQRLADSGLRLASNNLEVEDLGSDYRPPRLFAVPDAAGQEEQPDTA